MWTAQQVVDAFPDETAPSGCTAIATTSKANLCDTHARHSIAERVGERRTMKKSIDAADAR
jgi:hypothetical protein